MKYLLHNQESKRLTFRLLHERDFETWMKLFQEKDVARFLGFGHLKSAEEQCRLWFDIQEKRYKNELGGMNVLVDKKSEEFVGQCGLLIQEVDGKKEMEIGYSILPEFWRRGYASEAAQKCRDFAFENSFTDSVISIIHVDNFRSEKVAVKNGMRKTIKAIYKEMPVNIYRISKQEWLALKQKEL